MAEVKQEDIVIEQRKYDDYGRQIYVKNNEAEMTTVYDEHDQVIQETDERTNLTHYRSYDAYGQIKEETDSEGLTTTYEYDELQRKTATHDAYGRSEKLTYDAQDHVIATTAFDGTTTQSEYDENGNVIKEIDALGNETIKQYDALGQLIRESSERSLTEYEYDENGNQIAVHDQKHHTDMRYRYDANGNQTAATDAMGNTTKQEYDAKNRVIAKIDALGNRSEIRYDANDQVIKETDALGHTKQYRYNAYGLKTMEVDERGFETTYEYDDELRLVKARDAQGNEAKIEYDEQGQVEKTIDPNHAVTAYEYDAYGRVTTTTQPNGKTITTEYDALGQVVKEISGRKTTTHTYNDKGLEIETKINGVSQSKNRYNEYNQVIETTDVSGNVTKYTYDRFGNQIHSENGETAKDLTYDDNGNVIRQVDNDTLVTEYTYDDNERLIETKVNNTVTKQTAYDANGNEIRVKENGVERKYRYDANNRVIELAMPDQQNADQFVPIETLTYDESGNVIMITDALGYQEQRRYDANNQVIEVINKNGYSSLYEYDGCGQMTKAQNHEERYVTYTYDEMGKVKARANHDKTALYEYDEDGNLIVEEDEYGSINRYEYDALGQRTKWMKPDGSTVTYTYDESGNQLSENDREYTYDTYHHQINATNEEGTVTNEYDAFGNKTKVIDPNGNEIKYEYDENNRLIIQRYAGKEIHYSYDENNRLIAVDQNNERIAEYAYNGRGQIAMVKQGDTVTTKSYDDLGQVIAQKTVKQDEVIVDAAYGYDGNGNLISETIDGQTNTYEYNGYDELAASMRYEDGREVKTTYEYDLYGNQIVSSSTDGVKMMTYNDKNQVESIKTENGTTYLSYDANGNLIKKIHEDGQVDQYGYDDLGQLIYLAQGDHIYEYGYDAEHERIWQSRQNTELHDYQLWYETNEIKAMVSERDIKKTFAKFKTRVQESGDLCDIHTILTSEQTDTTTTYHTVTPYEMTINGFDYDWMVYSDDREVTTYTVDRNREYSEVVAENEETHIYGDTLIQSDETTIVSGLNNSIIAQIGLDENQNIRYDDYGYSDEMLEGHGYKGEMQDESGLIYLRARYYDPELMRFIQIDTHYDGEAEDVTSQNRYAYTLNNPYKYVDRDGNRPLKMDDEGESDSIIGKLVKGAVGLVKKVVDKAKQALKASKAAAQKLKNKADKKTTNTITNPRKPTVKTAVNCISEFMKKLSASVQIVKCPKPKNRPSTSYIYQSVDVRIRESRMRRIYGKASAFVKDEASFVVDENTDRYERIGDLIDFGSLAFSIANGGGIILDLTVFALSSLVDDFNKNKKKPDVALGEYIICFYWYVIRKEVEIKYPSIGYMKVFTVDKEVADGDIDKVHYLGSGRDTIFSALFEDGLKDPIAERIKYKDWHNNRKMAEDAALFYAGYTNGGALSTAWSNYLGFSPVSGFEFGDYSYYHINFN